MVAEAQIHIRSRIADQNIVATMPGNHTRAAAYGETSTRSTIVAWRADHQHVCVRTHRNIHRRGFRHPARSHRVVEAVPAIVVGTWSVGDGAVRIETHRTMRTLRHRCDRTA